MGMLGNGKTKREWKNDGKMEARRIFIEIGRLTGRSIGGSLNHTGGPPNYCLAPCELPSDLFHHLRLIGSLRIEAAIRRLPASNIPDLQVFCGPSAINRRNTNFVRRFADGSASISIKLSTFCLVLTFTGSLRF
ncbi:hypothetical protein HAX54_034992 [Datura stramonium]|uniref:Uncharacterized protein n=1 Tax=Datura stramonium TaxID=4076 RepID=A0ABS8VEX7_DATST|nr:hypothetical protein [Datura stramonium]